MRCSKVDSNKVIKISIRISEVDYKFLLDFAEVNNTSVSDALRKLIKLYRVNNKTQ